MVVFLVKSINVNFSQEPRKVIHSILLLIAGVLLGVMAKVLDETPSNSLPYLLEVLDLRNFFSRIGVWIFLAMLITLYSKSPFKSALNVFLFFAGMVGSYYLYTVLIAGFYLGDYMMIWIFITGISPFLAFLCWYARGKSLMAVSLSSLLIVVFSRQAFGFGIGYFHIKHVLELVLWFAAIGVLYRSPRQIIKVIIVGLILHFLTTEIQFFWGML
ncbi:hypothetical protein P6709_09405 [Jeotgalibacillus sp. ET6]|uniref:hypothetical protein n=1 Tax=Jeotgalibacillus sp. ET6 TaxID=3037260 RepID=UPI002418330D|nr:hypothetical protein [Jeotgalibacillus sp. ET6]MDG5471965.1 hypothetical protein [Jeotgalibacillus sp. ET6]